MSVHRKALGTWCAVVVGSFAIAVTASGCEETRVPPPPVSTAHASEKPGCNGGAFILAMQDDAECPSKHDLPEPNGEGHWKLEALCGGKPNLPKELKRYCALTWVADKGSPIGAPDAKELLELKGFEGVKKMEEDCVAVAPQGGEGPNVSSAEEVLRDKFRVAAGFPPNLSLNEGIEHNTSFVVAVDTLPHGKVPALFYPGALLPIPIVQEEDPFPFGQDEHGWTVLALIDDLTSVVFGPDGTQPTKLANVDAELALPSVDHDNIDQDNGGFFGRQFHLANALCSAIDDWEAWKERRENEEPGVTVPGPVVVMALGSLPVEGEQCDSDEVIKKSSIATRVVYAAMQHAACHGAALVAAAGNDPNGQNASVPGCDEVDGPTCPGAMSKIPMPTPTDCENIYGEMEDPKTGKTIDPYDAGKYHLYQGPLDNPLVHLISAVEPSGVLIAATRKGSVSKLAAIGTLGVAQDANGQWHTALTGTSVATAVAAAAFANLFAFQPNLTPAEAANTLYESALEPEAKQYADDGSGASVRMISICKALEIALKMTGNLGCQDKVDPNASMFVNDTTAADALDKKISEAIPLPVVDAGGGTNPSSKECTGNPLFSDPAPGSHKCNGCQYSFSTSDAKAFIQLAGGTADALSSLTLVLRSKEPGENEVFVLPGYGVPPGSTLVLEGINSKIAFDDLRSVTFEAIVETGSELTAVSGEIPIVHR